MRVARIVRDEDCASPRENDNLGTLCLFHRRYDLPNESKESIEWVQEHVTGGFDGVMLPVWAYDHSSVHYKAGARVGAFADLWDSGQAGVIYIDREKINAEYGEGGMTDAKIASYLEAEVAEFDAWSNGECYGYILADEEQGEEIESCYGFIGLDVAIEAAKEAGAQEIVE
jgi:hypothetical protein